MLITGQAFNCFINSFQGKNRHYYNYHILQIVCLVITIRSAWLRYALENAINTFIVSNEEYSIIIFTTGVVPVIFLPFHKECAAFWLVVSPYLCKFWLVVGSGPVGYHSSQTWPPTLSAVPRQPWIHHQASPVVVTIQSHKSTMHTSTYLHVMTLAIIQLLGACFV